MGWRSRECINFLIVKNKYSFLKKHLGQLNINKDDHLVVYSKISSFGITNKNFPKILLKTLKEYVGANGTIIMPSYTFGNEIKVFDKKKLLTNRFTSLLVKEFFKENNLVRSTRPIHSHIGIGRYKNILKTAFKNSFGKNSDFDFFVKKKFKCLLLGCDFNEGGTYFINLEHMNNVPYRKKIFIKKKVLVNNRIKDFRFKYNIKNTKKKIDLNLGFKKMVKIGLNYTSANLKFGKSYSLTF